MGDWTLGQSVVVVSYRGRETIVEDGEITKVGRKWLTVKFSSWGDGRFDLSGRSDQNWGAPPKLYASREAYGNEQHRRQLWAELRNEVRDHQHPPAHLTAEQITAALEVLRPTPSETKP